MADSDSDASSNPEDPIEPMRNDIGEMVFLDESQNPCTLSTFVIKVDLADVLPKIKRIRVGWDFQSFIVDMDPHTDGFIHNHHGTVSKERVY